MAKIKRMLISCAHCGRWMIVKTTGPSRTKPYIGFVEDFKTAPAGWTYNGGLNRNDILCPECIDEWKRAWNEFTSPDRLPGKAGELK